MSLMSTSVHQFSQVPSVSIPRSSFDRSHGLKTTFNADRLVPIYLDEVVPGDTFNLRMTAFARLATPIHPIMDNLRLSSFFFFVPTRLVWENWERFNGAQDDPGDSTDYTIPNETGSYSRNTLADYLGLPIGTTVTHSALPFRCVSLIWNEWFRDQNLQSPREVPLDDGGGVGDSTLPRRAKRHDYFTSCLPWPQKGDPVTIPILQTAPVIPDGTKEPLFQNSARDQLPLVANDPGQDSWTTGPNSQFAPDAAWWDETGLLADLTGATGTTINDLRQAFQIQRILERDARGGTRYIELIKSHFGVVNPDFRLQRPEYLGGGVSNININQVEQTSETSETSQTPQGNLAAYASGTLNGHGFVKSFTEHGYILGFVNLNADITYQQGMNRLWSRETRYDFYWPSLAQIGEQAVLSKEIYADGTGNDDNVFGYNERYAEMRYKPSQITGSFRSAAAESLDPWHLAEEFSGRPTLGNSFITSNTADPLERAIAVPSEVHCIMDTYFKLQCARPMPLSGVPGMIDHF